MDGTEDPLLLEEIRRLERLNSELIDLLADIAFRQALWQDLMTEQYREAAALRQTCDRLRDELRRYTRSRVG